MAPSWTFLGRGGEGQTKNATEPAPLDGQLSVHPQFQGGMNDQGMPYLSRAGSSEVAKTEDGRTRQVVQHEVSNYMAAQIHHPTAPVQLIIANHATSNSDQQVMNVSAPPVQEQQLDLRTSLRQGWADFIASPMNRFFLLGAGFMLVWLLHEREQHRWRMSEMQRRIDKNWALRVVQQLFSNGNRSK
mmetsp:Transcript_30686/g.56071  ORF Transcript_30686/g.56071 Transcript_30686/m.56071 type:complete len:187 (+) Transcript_30686:108-668(+)